MSNDPIDLEVLKTLETVMEGDFLLLIKTYLKDSEFRIEELDKYRLSADLDNLRRAAHSFKGSSSNLGALSLASHCMNLEEACKEGDTSTIDTILKDIKPEYERVKDILRTYV